VIAVVAASAIALALLIAALPARAAARTRPALVLRSE
jgi:ABC-type antimicrobial peptide transport system permease subunit